MFSHDFVRHAWVAGTGVGLGCGVLGWFVVLRAQLFAADALSHVAFVGAIAAALAAVDARIGVYVLTAAMALVLGRAGAQRTSSDEATGIAFAWVLGVGLLLLALLASSSAGSTGIAAVNALFGSIYSLGTGAAAVAAAVGLAVSAAVLLVLRPLLLASLDPDQAGARGVPVRLLSIAFLLALGLVTADGTQAVGALLVLGLLAAPAGAAHHLAADPRQGLAISAALAVLAVWGGLALSYAVASVPPSSAIIGLAAAAYLAAVVWRRGRDRGGRGHRAAAEVSSS